MLTLPVDCSGDFGPCGLSVQYTQDVRGTHISTLVLGVSTLALPGDCSGDFGPRGLSVQYTQDVFVCPPAHTERLWLSVTTHRTSVAVRVSPYVSMCVRQHTQDVRGCPSVHISARWSLDSARWPFSWTVRVIWPTWAVCSVHTGRLWVSARTHRMSAAVCRCPSEHTRCLWLYVCVRVCPSAHTRRLWLSISTHISTLVLGLSTLALPVDCSGDFGPRGLSVQYTQDVRVCQPTHTGHPWLSISTHISTLVLGLSTLALPVDCLGDFGPRGLTSVAVCVCPCVSMCVLQHTQDVRGCPSVHISAPWSLNSARWPFPWTVRDVRVCPSAHTGRPWLSVCVRVCPSTHTGRPWLSISTYICTLVLGLSTLTLPVDCLGDFGPRGLSASTHRTSVAVRQHTQDVRGCSCVSVNTHRMSVAVHQYTYQHAGPWTQHAGSCRGLFGTHMTSVAVRQHTQDVRGCPCVSVCVHVCPSAHTGCPRLSISTHISTLVLELSTLALPVDCSGDFGPRGLSFQYTQDVCGCPSEHTGHPCVSLSTHRTSVAVHVCPSTHTGRPWLSISTYISTLVLRLSTLTLPVDCSGDFGPRGLSVQYTQDVGGCPPAHTGRPWLSVCPSAQTGRLWLSISTHISTLVHGLSTQALPVDCSGDFGPRGLSVQYTQDVRGCPPAHTEHLWLSISTHLTSVAVCVSPCVSMCVRQHTQDVRGCPSVHISAHCTQRVSVGVRQHTQDGRCCPCVSVSTHRTSLAVHQYTYQHAVHIGRPWVSVGTHRTSVCVRQHTQDVRGCPCVSVCVRQHTQDIRGCPSVHISARCTHRASVGVRQHTQDGRCCPCVSISTHKTSVAVQQYTYQHAGPWTQHAGPSRGLFGTSVAVHQYTYQHAGPRTQHAGPSRGLFGTSVAVCVCPCVSMCVLQHTQDVRGCPSVHISAPWSLNSARWPFPWTVRDVRVCPSAHTGRPWLSVCVRVCPSTHTGRPWLSISTYICTLVLGLSTLTLPVDCSGAFGPRGLSASTHRTSVAVRQHTQDVRGCSCVSVNTHRMSVAVHQYTYQHAGPWTQHAGSCRGLFGTHMTSVAVRQHTQDVRGCPCVSVCVHVCPSAHTGCPRLSISTHISTLVLELSTLALPVDCSGDFGPRGLSFQYTQDVCGCPSEHTGHPCVSVSTHRTSVAVHVCPSTHTGRPWLSISTYISTLVLRLSTLTLPVDCSGDFGPRGLSVQYTQDVGGCPPAHTGRPWLSVCPSAQTGRLWLSISTHISTLVHGLSTQALPVDCSGDFGPRGLSVQYTQDVRGCPPAHTEHLWLSISTHLTSVAVCVSPCVSMCVRQHTQDVRGCPSVHISAHCTQRVSVGVRQHTQDGRCCPCVSVSTHRTSLAVHQYTYQHAVHIGRPWVSVGTHRTSVCVRQHTQDVRGCPCVSVCVRQHTQDIRGCPSVHISARCTHRASVGVRQHTQDGRCCPCVSISTHKTSVAVQQYTYQHAGPWTQHAGPSRGLFGTSVAVHQYTYQHAGPRTQHAGPSRGLFGTSVAVCVCPCVSMCVLQHTQDVRGCPSVHISAPWSLNSARWPFPWTVRDVRVCPSAHTGRPWLSVCVRVCPSTHTGRPWLSISTYICTLVLGLSTLTLPVDCSGDFGPRGLSASTHRTSVAVRQHTQDVRGCSCVSVNTHRMSVAVHQYTYQHAGPWTQHAGSCRGLFGTHMTSVAVRQHTQDVRGCPCVSVCVHVCPSAHTGCPRLSISTHISTLVLELSTLALPVDCSGDFGPRGLSFQYTQDVCGCPSEHTGHPCVSVSTHRTSVAVHVCPSTHTGRPWLSISTYISTLVLRLSTLTLSVDCSGDFGPRGLSVQYTQDVGGCPPAHTGRPWLSVCPSAQTGRLWLSISTHISTLVHGLSTQALPVDCSGDFGPRGLSVQYTQDVRGCPPAHTEHLWLSISTHLTSVAVCVSPCVSMCVRQHTQDVRGCPSVHISAHCTQRVSVGVRQHTQDGRCCPCVSVSTHRTSLAVHQYTYQHAVHIGRPWVSVGTHRTSVCVRQHTQDVRGCPCVSVCVRQHTQDIRGCPSVHISARCTHRASVGVRQHTQDGRCCPCVSISTHKTSVAVQQYTYQHAGPWTQHAGPSRGLFGTSVAVHQYTYQHAGPWTQHAGPARGLFGPYMKSVAVHQYTYQNAGPWTHHAGPSRGLFGRPCVSVSTHRMSVAVHVCPCVSVSTHKTPVAVHQCTYQHVGPRTQHADPSRGLFGTHISTLVLGNSTLALPVDCSGDFGPRGLSVQYTQDVRVCPPAHTGVHIGRVWVSVSTHRTSVAVCVCPTLDLPVDCSGDFGPRGLSFQYTQDVCGCPSEHTGRPFVSVSTPRTSVAVRVCQCVSVNTHRTSVALHHTHRASVGVRQHTHDGRAVRVFVSTHKTSVAVQQYTYQHAGPSRGMFGTSVAVRQHTQDVRGCPCVSVCVHVCPLAPTGCSRLSISTHISTLVLELSTLALPVDCSGDFGPRGLSFQYTQDVYGCPSEHTGRQCVSVSTHRTSVAVRVCPCVSVNTHRTSVAVHYTHRASVGVRQHTQDGRCCPCVSISTHKTSMAVQQYTYQHAGPWTQHAGPSRGLFGTSVAVHQYTYQHAGPWTQHAGPARGLFGPYMKSVAVHQYTYQNAGPWTHHAGPSRGLFGRPCVSVSTHRMSVAVRVCPCVSVSTHKTSVAVHQCTYQHVGPRTQHADPSRGLFGTHISTLVLGNSTLALPVDCSGDFGPRGLSVQYTQDVRVCPPAHTGGPWLSISTHISTLALPVDCLGDFGPRGLTHRMSEAVHQYTYQHAGPLTQHAGPSRGLFGTSVCVRQHTQDVRGCPCVTHRASVGFRQHTHDGRAVRVFVSTHKTSVAVQQYTYQHAGPSRGMFGTSVAVHQYTYQHAGPWTQHAGPARGLFGPYMTFVAVHQYTYQHAGPWTHHAGPSRGLFGRPCVSVSTHRMSVAVRVCPCVSVSTHKTSVAVHQCTYQRVDPWTQHADPSRGLFGTYMASVAVHQYTYQHAGPWTHHAGPSRGLFGTYMASVAVHQYTYQHAGPWTHHAGPSRGLFGTYMASVAVHQYTYQHAVHTGRPLVSASTHRTAVAVPVCPSAHTERLWLSISTHISTLGLGHSTLALPVDCSGDFGPRGLSVQYTQDVRVCPPEHTGGPWLSISTHISTLVLGLSTLALPVDCLGDFGPRGLTHRMSKAVHQYTYQHAGPWTQHAGPSRGLFGTHRTSVAVRVFLCVSVNTHRTSVAVHHTHRMSMGVRQHTQDVCGCLCVSVSTYMTSVAVHQYTYQHAGPWTQHAGPSTQHAGPSRGLFGTSVAVRQHTQDVRGYSCESMCVHVCPSAHTGCPCLSISTHISTLVLGLTTLALPVDCSGRPCLSVSTHRTSVAVRVCPLAHTGRQWLSISPHISMLVLGFSTLTLPVDCSGDFGPRGLSVQYTHGVRGCPPAHTGRLWLSIIHIGRLWVSVRTHWTSVCVRQHTQDVRGSPCVSVSTHRTSVAVRQYTYQHVVHTGCPLVSASTHRTAVAVRVCPSAHTGRLWLSIGTHISTLGLGHSTLALPVDCSGDFGPRGLSVQYTQDVRVCPPAHTGGPWLSISTHISTLVLGLSTLALPVDCLAHTGRPWLSVCVRVCPCVSFSTHRMSEAVHQYTYQHAGPWTQHAGPSRGLFGTHRTSVAVRVCLCVSVNTHRTSVAVHQSVHIGRPWVSANTHKTSVAVCVCPWLSISTHISTLVHRLSTRVLGLSTLVHGLSMLALPVDCSGDFGPRGLSVQYTQDVCGCPPAHTGPHTECPWLSISTHISTLVLGLSMLALPLDCSGRPCLSVSTHMTSVAVRVCPLAHTGRQWLSISTHISMLVLGFSTLTLPVDCSGDFGPRGLSVQYTQGVRGCPPAHTGGPWLSISTHISTLVLGLSTLALPVDCLGDFGPRGVSVQYTQDVCVCPPAHTGGPWLSISTHISTLVLGLSTLALPVECLGDFGPRGLTSVAVRVCLCVSMCVLQHTQDVQGCPSVHISARWPFPWTVRVILAHVGFLFSTHTTSVGVRQNTHDVCGCPLAHTGRPWLSVCVCVCPSTHTGRLWLSISTHISTLVLVLSTLTLPVDCLGDFGPRGLSVQYTQDVRGCPPTHTRRMWLSVCVRQHVHDVRGCPSVHISARWSMDSARWSMDSARWPFPWTVRVILAHVGCLFSTQRTSVGVRQHTQDVCGCPSAQTGRPWLSVCVRVCPSAHIGRPRLSISTHISMLVLGLSTLALPVDCSGDFGPRGLSVQYTEDVCGCPPAHTGRLWLSVSTHRTSVAIRVSPCVSMCVRQHTHRMSVAVHQYTYQHAVHTGRPWVSVRTHWTSVCVRQHTQDVRGCPCVSVSTHRTSVAVRQYQYQHIVHTGRPLVSASTHRTAVAVRVCPSAHSGRLWLSISTHISTLGLGHSTLALPVDCSGDFGPRGLSVQYTQDVRVCPPAHTGGPWLSISAHISTLVLGLSTLALPVDCFGDFGPRGLYVQYT
ncbi:hypothetical protein YC2023_066056 [Brassica napus]